MVITILFVRLVSINGQTFEGEAAATEEEQRPQVDAANAQVNIIFISILSCVS